MTLILSLMTSNYVIQVSDRRLTSLDGKYREDNRNKTVMLCQTMAFSYSGIAKIGGIDTDDWLSRELFNGQNLNLRIDEIGQLIANDVANAFKKLTSLNSNQKHHTFVGIGWVKLSPDNESLSPLIMTISNTYDKEGNRLVNASQQFTVRPHFLETGKRFYFLDTGQTLSKQARTIIERRLKVYAKKETDPLFIAQYLCNVVRNVSATNMTVGKSLLVISMPRPIQKQTSPDDFPGLFYIHAPPSKDAYSFFYVPADSNERIVYGPTIVCGGIMGSPTISPYNESIQVQGNSPYEYYSAIILSPWAGQGTWRNPQHPAIQDDYSIESSGHIGNAETWPKNEPCPYYGCVIGIKADDTTLNEIRKNNKYFILEMLPDTSKFTADEQWLNGLSSWLVSRGMPSKKAQNITLQVKKLDGKAMIDELISILGKRMSDEN